MTTSPSSLLASTGGVEALARTLKILPSGRHDRFQYVDARARRARYGQERPVPPSPVLPRQSLVAAVLVITTGEKPAADAASKSPCHLLAN